MSRRFLLLVCLLLSLAVLGQGALADTVTDLPALQADTGVPGEWAVTPSCSGDNDDVRATDAAFSPGVAPSRDSLYSSAAAPQPVLLHFGYQAQAPPA